MTRRYARAADRRSRLRSRLRMLAVSLSLLALVPGLASSMSRIDGTAPRAAEPLPEAPETASYRMEVELDPLAKTVTGRERMTYQNPSNDTLSELWLRLYLRAFSSPDTVWMQESGGAHRGYSAGDEGFGDIELHTLTLADGTDLLATASMTDTLVHVALPEALAPGERVELDATWTSTLPRVFARTGYGGRDDTFFMVGQWYPKLAVYHQGQWDTEPWHQNSEFFHDFGSYDVTISVPSEYVVAATGVPSAEPVAVDGRKRFHFTADNVTDFAFAASPDFQTSVQQVNGIDVVLYYLPEHAGLVQEYLSTAMGSLRTFSDWFGPYPHPRLTVVDVPDNAAGAGGMEYPTLITGGTLGLPAGTGGLSLVVAHEVAHQWWPMQTATNEGREPWLDEGLTEYSGSRYMAEAGLELGIGSLSVNPATFERASYAVAPELPATLTAWEYDGASYGSAVYNKPAAGLWTLERVVGTDRFRQAMADYLAAYRYRHPTGSDFRRSLEQSLDQDLSWFFDDYLDGGGVIDYAVEPVDPNSNQVVVRREGEVPAPVQVVMTDSAGQEHSRIWDGTSESTTLTLAGDRPVVQVQIDPERKLVAELDVLDNGHSVSPIAGSTVTLAGRLAFWAQALSHLLGLFG